MSFEIHLPSRRKAPLPKARASGSSVRPRLIKTATKNDELVRERRDLLVQAAIQVFLEKGFHNATVRDIGRAAKMTQGTIYNYVSSRTTSSTWCAIGSSPSTSHRHATRSSIHMDRWIGCDPPYARSPR